MTARITASTMPQAISSGLAMGTYGSGAAEPVECRFAAITHKINSMKALEDQLADGIHQQVLTLRQAASWSVGLSAAANVLMLALAGAAQAYVTVMSWGGAYGFAGNTAKVDGFSLLWQSKAQY